MMTGPVAARRRRLQPGHLRKLVILKIGYVLLSKAGDPLERLNEVVPWDVFRKPLAKALKRSDGSKGGRPAYPSLMMFKILVLQALYDLSDDQAEYVINDRLSFMRFIGIELGDKVPDARTIWLFREHLTQARAIDNLFARFGKHLQKNGTLAMGGHRCGPTQPVVQGRTRRG